ncbi:MAG: DUF4097 domain-containing protein [Treponema sp.]|jgi:DUF4097 and DUF4098 domain-containing protein YvlB|nr:DUF4097 domain-containing protein [Treponema sp.]
MKNFLRTNKQTVPVRDIDNIYVQYELDSIVLLTTEGDEMVVEEFLRWDVEDSDAKIVVSGRDVTIQGGTRLSSSNMDGLIKLYLPVSYRNNLHISNGCGSIVSECDLESTGQIALKVTSGSVKLKSIRAETVHLDAQSGSISLDRLSGQSVISAASGTINIREISGATQDIHAQSGSVKIASSCSDELNIRCQSGNVTIGKAVGMVHATCASGLITVHNMEGSGVFNAHVGNITLSICGTGGTYEVHSNVGNITLKLPKGAPYALEAKSMMSYIKRSSGDTPGLIINAKTSIGKIDITENEE